VTGPK